MIEIRLFRDCLSSYSSYTIGNIKYQEVPCSCHPETCCHMDGKVVIQKKINKEPDVQVSDTTMLTIEQKARKQK
jgi:hypothetical protein